MSVNDEVVAVTEAVATSAQPRNQWLGRALIAAAGLTSYIVIRMLFVAGPGAFPGAGNVFVGPGHPAELKILPNKGYDGQFVYRLAIEPLTSHLTGHGITFDVPAYRQQRIMTAALAWLVSGVPGISTAVALIVVNAIAVLVAIMAGLRLAADLDRRLGLGVLVAVPAGAVAGLVADLTEPVAWAGVMVGILAARRNRWFAAAVAFAAAMLARETAAIVVFGFLVETVVVLRRTRTAESLKRCWLFAAAGVETAWQLWLWHVWGTLPVLSGLRNTGLNGTLSTSAGGLPQPSTSGLPGLGIAQTFLDGLFTGDTSDVFLGASYLAERLALLALIAGATWALVTRRARPGLAITVAWCASAFVALSLRAWEDDIQFLRAAMEAWGLSVLVLLHSRTRLSRVVLASTAIVTCWVALYFWPRV